MPELPALIIIPRLCIKFKYILQRVHFINHNCFFFIYIYLYIFLKSKTTYLFTYSIYEKKRIKKKGNVESKFTPLTIIIHLQIYPINNKIVLLLLMYNK